MSFAYLFEEEAITSLLIGLFSGIPSGLLGIVSYVLTALALYTIAQRRQIQNAWMSWVPVLNLWILGSLSDQYRYVVKGQIKSKRKVLLVLNIMKAFFSVCITAMVIFMLVDFAGHVGRAFDFYDLENLFKPLLGLIGLSAPLSGIAIAIMVVRFIALYDVYVSVDPGNAALFLVLSILIPITEPFFLFFNREKDLGMPPRRDASSTAQPAFDQENKDYL